MLQRNFLWFSQWVGRGLPVIGIILALTLSGVSFHFGSAQVISGDDDFGNI